MDVSATAREFVRDPVGHVSDAVFDARVLREVGLLRADRPAADWRASRADARCAGAPPRRPHRRWPRSRDPDAVAVRDELGELTFEQVHRRSNALADALAERGVEAGDGVGIMCRNHRGFIDATMAAAKLGASILYPQHRLRRAPAGRGDGARGPAGADLRRGVRGPARGASGGDHQDRRLARRTAQATADGSRS